MKFKEAIIICILLLVSLNIARADEEEETMIVTFKDINVFEYNVALIFEDENGDDVWLNYFDIDLEEYEFYTITYEEESMFPEYHVNPEKVDKQFLITYIGTEVEGEFSGEMEEALVVTNIEQIEPSEEEEEDDEDSEPDE